MKRRNRQQLRRWLTGATATLTALPAAQPLFAVQLPPETKSSQTFPVSLAQYGFQHDGVLGTSLDLIVDAVRSDDARVCEQQVLAEIERLRRILSTYDPASEISQVCAGAPIQSKELADLLSAYEIWEQRTGGAINVNMAEVIRLWKQSRQQAPDPVALANASAIPRAYNVDALGKGYIVDRAVEIARRFAPAGLLNIGGDIRVWGDEPWMIGVANPFEPAENAPLLTHLTLRESAVATSGGYSRFVDIDGQRYSHMIDPRTLQPASQIRSATVVAVDCLTANALSTAASVLGLEQGAKLVKLFNSLDYVLVDSQGRLERTGASVEGGVSSSEPAEKKPATEQPVAPQAGPAWPTNYQVSVELVLKTQAGGGRGVKRPYVAIWVEDSNKKLIRTVTVMGNNFQWMRELTTWWKVADSYSDAFTSRITRATRPPGTYKLIWDGLDDQGKPVPQGEYKIFLEVNREHGRHLTESVAIKCETTAQSAEVRATPESDVSKVEYGPKPE